LHKIILVVTEWCKLRTNEEINLLIKHADIVGYIKTHRIR